MMRVHASLGPARFMVSEGDAGDVVDLESVDLESVDLESVPFDVVPLESVPLESVAPEDAGTEDFQLPEWDLPDVDAEDAEALMEDVPGYSDLLNANLLDDEWVAAIDMGEGDDDRMSNVEVGLTLDLNGPDMGDELAQMLDLDVGALLTSLPQESSRLELDGVGREFGQGESPFAVGALRDFLLPEGPAAGELELSDEGIGDDERFPVFEQSPSVLRPLMYEEDQDGVPDDDAP